MPFILLSRKYAHVSVKQQHVMFSTTACEARSDPSRMLKCMQAWEMGGVCCVLQSVGDPLCLSLALDIMEEVLAGGGDPRKAARAMARDGALAALVSPDMPIPCQADLLAA